MYGDEIRSQCDKVMSDDMNKVKWLLSYETKKAEQLDAEQDATGSCRGHMNFLTKLKRRQQRCEIKREDVLERAPGEGRREQCER